MGQSFGSIQQELEVEELYRLAKEAYVFDDPLIGRVLENKYTLESLISKGGMGSVYQARRRIIGDLVAVKVLKIAESIDPVSLKRFQLEAAAAASIKHQNVVAIHDFGLLDDDQIAYLVMEHLEGPALSDEIKAYGAFSLERAIRIFKQVCTAISAAHKKGIIHRDLKPSNIIFQHANCVDDLIKVVDFGLAKLIRGQNGGEKLTADGSTVGTPAYMSPEQCLGQRTDEHADIYSLGIVLYEMLTGDVPFHESVGSAVLVQHITQMPRSMLSTNPDIPQQVDAVVMKALEKNPEKRYRSAIEMATEFELACRNGTLAKKLEPILKNNGAQTDSSTITLSSMAILLQESHQTQISLTQSSTTDEDQKIATSILGPLHFSFERFIGRNEELKQMEERFEQVKAGLGRALFVVGDPGVGKTELVNQFQRQLSPNTATLLMGKFYEYGSDVPYRPYLDCLYSFTRNSKKYSPEGWLLADETGLTDQIEQGLGDIDSLINVSHSQSGPVEEQIKYRAFELLTKIFVTISASTPVILFLDDLQWADPLSLEFLAYLIRNTEKNRIFVLCTARGQDILDESRPIKTWLRRISGYKSYDQIKLGSLTDIEARALIDSIFGNIKITEGVIRRFYEVTQGNPFYLCEIIRQLIQEQKIYWMEERWQCADLDEIELPGSILELVELRLKRLTDETIDVFTRAAVVGEKFSFQMLRTITELPKNALMEIIDIGLREFIIKESTPSEPSTDDYFAFCHSTLRKVLYERLSSYRRCRLHSQIGDKLENLSTRKLDRVASELAYHFYYGANHCKALHYSVAAGETARNVFAIDEALKFYSWAEESLQQMIEAGEQLDCESEWMGNFRLAFGNVLMHMGKNDGAREQLDLALKLSQEAGLVPLQGKTLQAMGELSWSRGHYNEALGFCEEGLKLLNQAGEVGRECRLFGVIGDTYFSQGQFDQAVEFYNKSLELARQVGDRASEGEALRRLGSIMGFHNQARSALDHLKQALTIARATGNRQSEWLVMNLIGNIYLEQGEPTHAAEYYRHSLAIARAIGRRRGECRVALNMGELCRQGGDHYNAKTYFTDAQTIAAEIQDREIEGHALSNLGLVYQSLRETEQAMDCFQKALEIFRETHYRSQAEAEALSGIAIILLEEDKVAEAKCYFEKAVESGRELGLGHLLVPTLRCLATCEYILGEPVETKKWLADALNIVRTLMATKLPDQEYQLYMQAESELVEEIKTLEEELINKVQNG